MRIQTERLELIALTTLELATYLAGDNRLEAKFGLKQTGRSVIAGIRSRVERGILHAMENANAGDYLFLTFWIVVNREDKSIVAELGFKGLPDKNGAVEIGYGTMPSTRNKGYMTEAVQALSDWALMVPGIKMITAETERDNFASIRVLEKNGFSFLYDRGQMKWWQLPVISGTERRYNCAE